VAVKICECVDRDKLEQAAAAGPPSSSQPAKPKRSTVIGADDLLLLYTYIVIKSNVPHLCAEINFMDDFLPDHQRCLMKGYYLATMQAVVEFISSDDFTRNLRKT